MSKDSNNKMENNMNNAMACLISNSGIISIVINGKPYSVAPDHLNYKALIKAIKAEDQAAIVELVDIPKAVSSFTSGAVQVVDGQVLFNNESIHTSIADRILGLMSDDMPFKFMVNFLDNLMTNPSYRAINELYDFLDFANIPITDDGCFLAYKRVKDTYLDIYSGKVDNSVGEKPEMPRNMVDEDKNRTCSSGYHFCSLDYIPHFGASQDNSSDRVMIVKINPRDVVAIPADYNNTKGRCCLYEVVAEYDGDWRKDAFTKSVHHKDGTPYELDDEDDTDSSTESYDEDGYDEDGYNAEGLDAEGYDRNGFDENGYDWDGYDENGFDSTGYDRGGLDEDGYDTAGYNDAGYDADGFDEKGNPEVELTDEDDKSDKSDSPDSPDSKKFYGIRNALGKFISKGDK